MLLMAVASSSLQVISMMLLQQVGRTAWFATYEGTMNYLPTTIS
jgi:hypothetical protein